MLCPHCGANHAPKKVSDEGQKSRVLDMRHNDAGIRRRRVCSACGKRFTTREVAETSPPPDVQYVRLDLARTEGAD